MQAEKRRRGRAIRRRARRLDQAARFARDMGVTLAPWQRAMLADVLDPAATLTPAYALSRAAGKRTVDRVALAVARAKRVR